MKNNKWSQSTAWTPLSLVFCVALMACTPAEPPNESVSKSESPTIDLIVEGEYVVTMDESQSVVKDGAVAITDGLIVALGYAGEIKAQYTAVEHLAGKNRIAMPGLINGHSHAAMTLLRGVADDLALMDWLNNYIFPAEVEFVDANSFASVRSSHAGR